MASFLLFSLFFLFLHFILLVFSASIFEEFLLELSLGGFSSFFFHLHFLLDIFSTQFISFILLISSVVLYYSSHYMAGDASFIRFIFLLMLFVFSMAILVLSPSLLILMFGWDGLGITSFLLVVYYNNFSSLRSGLVTIYINRLGDIFLVFSFYLLISMGWAGTDFMLLEYSFPLFLLLVLSGMTKSAQLPFSTWLPAAMAAPTPISSLVHSSTLVTAGVFMFIRYFFLFDKFIFSSFFLFVFLITSFSAGIFACFESDLSKLVAMSTLSQLGLMMVSLSLGNLFYSFFHMLSHALFKSLLFLSCGFLILVSLGSQDMRFKGNKFCSSNSIVLMMFLANVSLCGFPFFSGFFSKDLIIESLFTLDSFLYVFILFCGSCLLSIIYSYRVFLFSFYGDVFNFPSSMTYLSSLNFLFMFLLLFWSISLGKTFCFLFMEGELVMFAFPDKFLGALFFLASTLFIGFVMGFSVFFLEMLWLNWFFGTMFSSLQVSSYLAVLGEFYWLEYLGPKGLSSFFYSCLLAFKSWGSLKTIFFTFVLLFMILF